MARILITSAIPYINGIKHLGNLVGSQLPADLYARYARARGDEVLFLCATDEHGTPAELAAAKAGKPVAEYCAEMWQIQKDLADGFRLSFDKYGRSARFEPAFIAAEREARIHRRGIWSPWAMGYPNYDARMDEPQKRLVVTPAVSFGRPARKTTLRAMFRPCSPSGKAQPSFRSSIFSGLTPVFSISPLMVWASRSSACTSFRSPFLAGVKGERT